MLTDIAKAAEEAGPMRATSLIRRRGDQRRNRQRAAVGVLSVIAVGAIVATGSFLGMHRTDNNLPAISPSTTASPAVTASPTVAASSATVPAATTDLTVTAGQIITNGSSGNIEGTVRVTVRNQGPAAVDRVDLTFPLTSGVQPTGATWTGCTGPDAHQTITCAEPAPGVGASRDYTFQFAIDTGKLSIGSNREPILPSVTVQPHGATDAKPADNTVTLTMCTNGCTGPFPSAGAVTGLPPTGCPVTAETLLAALKADDASYAEAGVQAAKPVALEGITCYDTYALAHSAPLPGYQPPKELFAFDPTTRTWKPVHVSGSSGWCRNYVSDDINRHLGGC
jgi:hypothetical protein